MIIQNEEQAQRLIKLLSEKIMFAVKANRRVSVSEDIEKTDIIVEGSDLPMRSFATEIIKFEFDVDTHH